MAEPHLALFRPLFLNLTPPYSELAGVCFSSPQSGSVTKVMAGADHPK